MTGNEDHSIDLTDAAKLTRRFQTTPLPSVANLLSPVISEAFGKDAIQSVLDQDDCTGIRIYYGLDMQPTPKLRLVIVGVDDSNDDLVEGIILENGNLCPFNCPTSNELNS